MKLLKIKVYTLRFLSISATLLISVACTEKTSSQTTNDEVAHTEETQKAAIQDIDKGEASFQSGLKAAEANNMPQAFKDFSKAANEGHDFAQFNLALMYEQGLGVTKDEKEALFWYEKSASQGNSAAQFNLAVFFENGRGTVVDYAKANEWYRKASVQGDGLAIGNLGMLYIRGQGVKENKVAGIALLLMSTTIDASPENQAKNNITATRGLTTAMITEAQALSEEMSKAQNMLVPLDRYLKN